MSKSEYFDYKGTRAEWDKTYGDKAAVPTSIIERLRQIAEKKELVFGRRKE